MGENGRVRKIRREKKMESWTTVGKEDIFCRLFFSYFSFIFHISHVLLNNT